jgi:copper(I)-binding protein
MTRMCWSRYAKRRASARPGKQARWRWAALVVTVVALVTGCGAGQVSQTAQQVGATLGNGGSVGQIQLRDATFVFQPPIAGGSVYQPGQDAPLQLTIINEGTEPDRLIEVSSPVAAGGRVSPNAQVGPGQVLTAGYQQPLAVTPRPGTTGIEPALTGLREPIRAGLTYPVTFTFQRSGQLSLVLGVDNPLNPRTPQQ